MVNFAQDEKLVLRDAFLIMKSISKAQDAELPAEEPVAEVAEAVGGCLQRQSRLARSPGPRTFEVNTKPLTRFLAFVSVPSGVLPQRPYFHGLWRWCRPPLVGMIPEETMKNPSRLFWLTAGLIVAIFSGGAFAQKLLLVGIT